MRMRTTDADVDGSVGIGVLSEEDRLGITRGLEPLGNDKHVMSRSVSDEAICVSGRDCFAAFALTSVLLLNAIRLGARHIVELRHISRVPCHAILYHYR